MITARRFSWGALTCLWLLLVGLASPARALDYIPYSDQSLGFACQVPSHWLPQPKPPATLTFSGPAGSEQYFTTINMQLVKDQASSLEAQVQEFLNQMGRLPHYRLLSRQGGTLAGRRGVRLLVEYQLPDNQQLFRQVQFVAERAPYFFWLAYTAPVNLFDQHQAIMDKVLDSLQFLPLADDQAAPPAGQQANNQAPASAPPQAPGAPALQQAPPAPRPAPPTAPPSPPALPPGQAPRVYDLRLASGISEQGPSGVSQVFPVDTPRIYAWFRIRNLPPSTELRVEWYFGEPGQMKKVTEGVIKVQESLEDHCNFELSINPGSKFLVGHYRVDILVGRQLEASAKFQVR